MGRILLIEGNALNREMLSCRLEHRRHQVVCAADGLDGLEAGCDEYESKPVDFCWLPDKIDAHME